MHAWQMRGTCLVHRKSEKEPGGVAALNWKKGWVALRRRGSPGGMLGAEDLPWGWGVSLGAEWREEWGAAAGDLAAGT